MCGILAVFSNGASLGPDSCAEGLSRLHRRGPDHSGLWMGEGGTVCLGHRRLRIVDLDASSDQPIANESGDVRAVVNGEFYGYLPIREKLFQAGHRFAGTGDSEILLHLYEMLGENCLSALRGEFAFALWDAPRKRMFVARDRFGIKPLYYAKTKTGYAFASEIKALLPLLDPPSWDLESVAALSLVAPLQDRTLFAGVHQIRAGCYAVVTSDGIAHRRYWDLDYAEEEGPGTSPNDGLLSRLRSKLEECVQTRLQADVPVGLYLSGGVDSTTVAHVISSLRKNVPAFCLGFSSDDFDEVKDAEKAAQFYGLTFHASRAENQDMLEAFTECVWLGETIQENMHGVARFMLSKQVHLQGIRCVLSGDGGDELFFGYGHFQSDLSAPLDGNVRQEVFAPFQSRLGFVPTFIKQCWASKLRLQSLMPGLLRDHPVEKTASDLLAQFSEGQLSPAIPAIRRSGHLWIKSMFVNYLLFCERLDSGNAVEVRMPLLDHEFFEATKQIPAGCHRDYFRKKAGLREIVRKSGGIDLSKPKQGFVAPPMTLLSGTKAFDGVYDVVLKGLESMPFLDAKKTLRLLDAFAKLDVRDRMESDPTLQVVISLCLLQRAFRLT